jgi:hypothetical protein
MALFLPFFLVVLTIHWIALLLDEVLFPRYRRIRVKEPVFIVGVPRSGTTFLHRLLAVDDRFTTFCFWELVVAPAIVEKLFWLSLARMDAALGGPLNKALRWVERWWTRRFETIHPLRLDAPEEDYLALIPVFACFVLVYPFPFAPVWDLAYFDCVAPPERKRLVMRFYHQLIQRHLWVRGPHRRFLSKNASFSPLVQCLADEFPDCRIVASVRTPARTVPSLLSGMQGGWALFGNDGSGDAFRDRIVELLAFYYRHLAESLDGMDRGRARFVDFDTLVGAPVATACELEAWLGHASSANLVGRLDVSAESWSEGRGRHPYSLRQFGLNMGHIERTFAFAYARFGFARTHEPDACGSPAQLGLP